MAAGWNACSIARADAAIVAAFGIAGAGTECRLSTMYSDRLATAELASENLVNLTGDASLATALGTFTLASQEIAEAAFALPFNFSGAWVTSFSNLNLPSGVYWRLVADPLAPPNFRDWVASLPPDMDAASDAAADNLHCVTWDVSEAAAGGALTWATEQIAEAAFALPFNVSGRWVTSFRNLNLPAGVYREEAPDRFPPATFRDWVGAPSAVTVGWPMRL
jgi:hypothetical protein